MTARGLTMPSDRLELERCGVPGGSYALAKRARHVVVVRPHQGLAQDRPDQRNAAGTAHGLWPL